MTDFVFRFGKNWVNMKRTDPKTIHLVNTSGKNYVAFFIQRLYNLFRY